MILPQAERPLLAGEDRVALFQRCAFGLLQQPGGFGLLATNTIAQGDTREVGLDQLVERGATITRAVPSGPWPGTTSLEVAKVWVRKGEWRGARVLSGLPVQAISPMLVVTGRALGKPHRLKANENKSFQGSIVLGMGFIMTPEEAQTLIVRDPRNRDVLFPYLNGEDLNSRPDQSPSRWAINFRGWPLERSADGSWETADVDQRTEWLRSGRVPKDYLKPVAADYPDCLSIVRSKVKPERDKNNRAVYKTRWWQYAEKRPELYATIADMERVIVCPIVTKFLSFVYVPSGVVFMHKLCVLSIDVFESLNSSFHDSWAREYCSTLETRLNYSPSDGLETFP
jgi:hypothetical protein